MYNYYNQPNERAKKGPKKHLHKASKKQTHLPALCDCSMGYSVAKQFPLDKFTNVHVCVVSVCVRPLQTARNAQDKRHTANVHSAWNRTEVCWRRVSTQSYRLHRYCDSRPFERHLQHHGAAVARLHHDREQRSWWSPILAHFTIWEFMIS